MKRPNLARSFVPLGILFNAFTSVKGNDLDEAKLILNGSIFASPYNPLDNDMIANASSPYDLSAYGPISCLQNPPPPAPPTFDRITSPDYYELLENIDVDDDALRQTQQTFRSGDFKNRVKGRCSLSIGLLPGQSETPVRAVFRPIDFAHIIAKIKQKCLVGGDVLGGTVRWGPNFQLLAVLGARQGQQVGLATS